MPKDTPYRAPIAPEVSAPIPPLVVVWRDAERSPWKGFLLGYYGLLGAALGLAALASVSPHAAGVCAAGGGGYWGWRRRKAVVPGFTLDVTDGTLTIQRAGEAAPVAMALSAVRDVEMERKAIQRLSVHQGYGDAVPTTALSGDLEVARIVVVCDGPDARVRLTESYAPVFVCMEHFGKVRTFLRRHGWKPADERAAE